MHAHVHSYKGVFSMTNDGGNESSVKGQLVARLKPWNKRWFVLSDDGGGRAKLYYYKAPEERTATPTPLDLARVVFCTPLAAHLCRPASLLLVPFLEWFV